MKALVKYALGPGNVENLNMLSSWSNVGVERLGAGYSAYEGANSLPLRLTHL